MISEASDAENDPVTSWICWLSVLVFAFSMVSKLSVFEGFGIYNANSGAKMLILTHKLIFIVKIQYIKKNYELPE